MTHLLTFLFTDIQSSSLLWEQSPASMRIALAQHDALLKDTVDAHNGRIVKTTGDGLLAVFESASDGIAAALEGQRCLADENWPAETGPLQVRMGLHSGESQERDADFFGPVVNRRRASCQLDLAGKFYSRLSPQNWQSVSFPRMHLCSTWVNTACAIWHSRNTFTSSAILSLNCFSLP